MGLFLEGISVKAEIAKSSKIDCTDILQNLTRVIAKTIYHKFVIIGIINMAIRSTHFNGRTINWKVKTEFNNGKNYQNVQSVI